MSRLRILRILRREGGHRRRGPTGEVGLVHRTSTFEIVWVRKERDAIDPEWFEMPQWDVLTVLQGRLRVDFEDRRRRSRILGVGDTLVLPPRTKVRAYRWPRTARAATVFVATYPIRSTPIRAPAVRRAHSRGRRT